MRPVANKKLESRAAVPSRQREDGKADFLPLTARLAARGFRLTQQRQQVYDVLLGQRDHPTAEQVFIRSKTAMPSISVATVYNCLTALVKSGLVRQVAVDRGASRFCPNMKEHCHFYCDSCERVFDIDLLAKPSLPVPKGFTAERFDLSIHGRCPACSRR